MKIQNSFIDAILGLFGVASTIKSTSSESNHKLTATSEAAEARKLEREIAKKEKDLFVMEINMKIDTITYIYCYEDFLKSNPDLERLEDELNSELKDVIDDRERVIAMVAINMGISHMVNSSHNRRLIRFLEAIYKEHYEYINNIYIDLDYMQFLRLMCNALEDETNKTKAKQALDTAYAMLKQVDIIYD